MRVGCGSLSKTFTVQSQVYHDIWLLRASYQSKVGDCLRNQSNLLIGFQFLNKFVIAIKFLTGYFLPFKTRVSILCQQIQLCIAFLKALHNHHAPQFFPLHLHEIFNIHGRRSCWLQIYGCPLWILTLFYMASIPFQLLG